MRRCCVGYFGFMRVGEFTVPHRGAYDPLLHLSWTDRAVYRAVKLREVRYQLKATKTEPIQKGSSGMCGGYRWTIVPNQSSHGVSQITWNRRRTTPSLPIMTGTHQVAIVALLHGTLARDGLAETEFNGHSLILVLDDQESLKQYWRIWVGGQVQCTLKMQGHQHLAAWSKD